MRSLFLILFFLMTLGIIFLTMGNFPNSPYRDVDKLTAKCVNACLQVCDATDCLFSCDMEFQKSVNER